MPKTMTRWTQATHKIPTIGHHNKPKKDRRQSQGYQYQQKRKQNITNRDHQWNSRQNDDSGRGGKKGQESKEKGKNNQLRGSF